jgi:hypothetical protein
VKGIQDQQILITGEDGCALTGARGCQHDVVIAVATNRGLQYVGYDNRERLFEQPNSRSNVLTALMEFFTQDTAKLVEQWLRGNHDMVPYTVLQKVTASAARHESGDQHIRIQQESHDTRLNTSSSVKIP